VDVADLTAASRFVVARGSAEQCARLSHLTYGHVVDSSVIEDAAAAQLADGGFSTRWSPQVSVLDGTCARLSQLRDLGSYAAPLRRKAIGFLLNRQRPDGSFTELPAHTVSPEAPAWVHPGEVSSRLYLTADCAYWLDHELGRGRPAARAADYLVAHIGADRRLPSYLHAHWLSVPVLRSYGYESEADGFVWMLASRLDGLGPTSLAWMIDVLRDEVIAEEARLKLGGLQRSDGSWAAEVGPDRDVETTLQAIRALL